MPATHALVTKLVQLIVETGMLTALMATIDLILFMAFPHTAYHAAIALTLAKLYSNSMLVILNSRIRIIGGRNPIPGDTIAVDMSTGYRGGPKFATRRSELTTLGGVHIQEQTWTESESIPMEEPQVNIPPYKFRQPYSPSTQNAYGVTKPRHLAEDV